MKITRLISGVWGAMLGFFTGFSAVACLVTAFDMPVDMAALALWCLGAAVVCSFCYSVKLGWIPLCAGAAMLAYLWWDGSLLPSVEALLNALSSCYNQAYEWKVIHWSSRTIPELEAYLPVILSVLAVGIVMEVTWSVCRRRTIIPGFVSGLLPLTACLVVTDRVPQTSWLYFLLLGLIMLLLTGTARQQDEKQGNRATALLALPVALGLLIMLAVYPQEKYTGQGNAQKMVETVLNIEPIRSAMAWFTESGTTGNSIDGRSVDLKTIGPRITTSAEILRMRTDYDDVVYLRGRALDTYDGISWTDSGNDAGELEWPVESRFEEKYEVIIATRYAHQMLYVPYNTISRNLQYTVVGVNNEKKLSQYSFTCQKMAGDDYFRLLYPDKSSWVYAEPDTMKKYTYLSDEVKQWAEPLAHELTNGINSYYHRALAIRDYVRDSAVYDTNTQRLPEKETDFAKWFLEQSDTGYCVHYATAATVLLQAAGIPARYVTGYMVDMRDNTEKIVRADNSHAWTEYWLPGYGWTVLEATPSAQEEEPTEPSQATQPTTEPTEPASTTTPAQNENTPQKPGQTAETVDLTVLWIGLMVLAAIGAVEGQRRLRLYLRRKRLARGSTNQQALARWQEVVRVSALTKQTPDGELLELAMMAKFSQYTMTREQVAQFDDYLNRAYGMLKKRSIFHRFWYRVVLVVY